MILSKKTKKNSIFAVLDLGSTKTVCFIAKMTVHGQMEIIGIGYNISNGIRAGRITDIKAAEASIAQAVESAEKMAGESIKRVYVSLSSNNLISQCISSDLVVKGHEINDKDLNKLLFQVLDRYSEQDLEVIHTFAYDYMLDGNRGIENPLGMYGNMIAAEFHFVTTPATHLLNVTNCVARCQLEVENYIAAAYASGLATLTQDELDLGVTLVEFGGGCTSISVFFRGHLLFTDAIPIGGMHVTNDIAKGLATDFASAERIKMLYGSALFSSADSSEIIETPISGSADESEMNVFSRSLLTEIIRARIDEILDIIKDKFDSHMLRGFAGNKIVITGGASQLPGLKDVVYQHFEKPVRVGLPVALHGLAESMSSPAFASAVGMLIHIADLENSSLFSQQPANNNSPFGNVFQWFKENFG